MQGDTQAFWTLLMPDETGTAYLPTGLAGSTLTFVVDSYVPFVVREWNGQELTVQLQRSNPR